MSPGRRARAPRRRARRRRGAASSSSRPVIATRQPSPTSSSAVARPMPRLRARDEDDLVLQPEIHVASSFRRFRRSAAMLRERVAPHLPHPVDAGAPRARRRASGTCRRESRSRQCAISASASRSPAGTTNATTSSPQRSEGTPATATWRDRRVVLERGLDLARVDVQPAADDQLLAAAGDLEAPVVGVEPAEVAGAEPAVGGERLRRGLGALPVAREDLRAADEDLPVRPRRGASRSRAAPSPRGRAAAGRRRVRDVEPGLGAAVALERGAAPSHAATRSASAAEQRRRAGDREAQRGQVRGGDPLPGDAGARTSPGTANSTVAPCAAIASHSAAGSKRLDHDGARPGQQAEVHAAQAVLVRERQRVDEDVVRAPAPRRASTPRVEARTLACVSGTPFGAPVVPEVYASIAGAGSGSGSAGSASIASSARRAADRDDRRDRAGPVEALARVGRDERGDRRRRRPAGARARRRERRVARHRGRARRAGRRGRRRRASIEVGGAQEHPVAGLDPAVAQEAADAGRARVELAVRDAATPSISSAGASGPLGRGRGERLGHRPGGELGAQRVQVGVRRRGGAARRRGSRHPRAAPVRHRSGPRGAVAGALGLERLERARRRPRDALHARGGRGVERGELARRARAPPPRRRRPGGRRARSRSASSAPTGRIVRQRSIARPRPTSDGSAHAPTASPCPGPASRIRAPGDATRRSAAIASCAPPPTAGPSSAATTIASHAVMRAVELVEQVADRRRARRRRGRRSAPAQNAAVEVEPSTTTGSSGAANASRSSLQQRAVERVAPLGAVEAAAGGPPPPAGRDPAALGPSSPPPHGYHFPRHPSENQRPRRDDAPRQHDDGVRLHVEEAGDGPPVLFVHEFARRPPQLGAAGPLVEPPLPLHRLQRARLPAVRRAGGRGRATRRTRGRRRHRRGARRPRRRARARRRPVDGRLRHAAPRPAPPRAARARSSSPACGYGAQPEQQKAFREESSVIADAFAAEGAAEVAKRYAVGPARVQFQNKDPRGWAEFARAARRALVDRVGADDARRAGRRARRSTT